MQAKQGLLAVALLFMAQNTQALQLTSTTVVGNLLFEQNALYALALLMLLASIVL
jgi:hypothetical protein